MATTANAAPSAKRSRTTAPAPNAAMPPVRRRRKPLAPYFLLIPAAAILLFGMGYPVGWQFATSMQKYGQKQQFGAPPEFVWFDNFIAVATSDTFWWVVARSLVFCIVTAVITVVIGMALAVLMTRVPSGVRLTLQIALLLAWATPVVAAMTVWMWLFDRRRGVINYLLSQIPGVDMQGFNWLGTEPWLFFLVASIIVTWMSVPFVAFSAYAGLTQVSGEVLEASALDGASGWQRFLYIILPTVRPVIAIVLLLNLIWDLRVFAQITMLQDSGSKSTDFDLLGTYIYKMGVAGLNYGQGAAMSVFVLGLTIALSWFYIRSLLKEDQA